tara:strand:- start:2607 stop:3392 length:786 start_codon:yes stop_codon:yes gene_type:complete
MNFREQLKDPTEAMRTLFDTGLVVMEGDENITDKDLTDFAGLWGELSSQTSKFWYNGNSKVAELSAGKMFGTSELSWHKDSAMTESDFGGTMLYNKSEKDIKSSTFFVGTTTYNNPDKYEFFYHTCLSNNTQLDEKENRIVEILNKGGKHADRLLKKLNWNTDLINKSEKRPFKDIHPITGKTVYYCSPATMIGNKDTVNKLTEEFIEQNVNVEHKWKRHQVIIWDNFVWFHKRYATEEHRCMLRVNFSFDKDKIKHKIAA